MPPFIEYDSNTNQILRVVDASAKEILGCSYLHCGPVTASIVKNSLRADSQLNLTDLDKLEGKIN